MAGNIKLRWVLKVKVIKSIRLRYGNKGIEN
jgi:hypothetical protein